MIIVMIIANRGPQWPLGAARRLALRADRSDFATSPEMLRARRATAFDPSSNHRRT